MATVFATSATNSDDEHGRLELKFLLDSAERDRVGTHSLSDIPDGADIIIFVEREKAAGAQLEKVCAHPLYKRYPNKCYVVNPRYKGVPVLPGIYASIRESWYDPSRIRSSHYLEVREDEYFRDKGSIPDDAYLYSFRGKLGTAPIRQRLAELSHPCGTVQDTTDQGVTSMMKMKAREKKLQSYKQNYARLIANSKFVLCPRGTGPSSLRLFETLLMGRVPVIISDEWVPPEGPDWDAFSIRVEESRIGAIPALLEQHEEYAEEMGRRARQVWDTWFAPSITFHRIVEWCRAIRHTEANFKSVCRRYRSYASLLSPVRRAEALIEKKRLPFMN